MSFKLLVEKTDPAEFEYILEEKNTKEAPRLYIKGPYMMADGVNKNKRVYDLDNMIEEVTRYEKEMIKQKNGNILNIVTTYAWTGSGYVIPSASAKAGVLAMTRSMAVEWAK